MPKLVVVVWGAHPYLRSLRLLLAMLLVGKDFHRPPLICTFDCLCSSVRTRGFLLTLWTRIYYYARTVTDSAPGNPSSWIWHPFTLSWRVCGEANVCAPPIHMLALEPPGGGVRRRDLQGVMRLDEAIVRSPGREVNVRTGDKSSAQVRPGEPTGKGPSDPAPRSPDL